MGIIRGKLETYRDVIPKEIVVGKPIFYEKNGKWYLYETGEEIEVEILTWDELFNED